MEQLNIISSLFMPSARLERSSGIIFVLSAQYRTTWSLRPVTKFNSNRIGRLMAFLLNFNIRNVAMKDERFVAGKLDQLLRWITL